MADAESALGVEVAGWGEALPDRVWSTQDIIDRFGLESNVEWVTSHTGTMYHHIARRGNRGETTTALSVKAAEAALRVAGLELPLQPDAIDAVYVASITPDSANYVTSPTHSHVQEGLSIHCGGAVINNACAGWATAANMAYDAFAARPEMKRAMVIGVDRLSSIVDWKDRDTAFLFGDGAAAVLFQRTKRLSAGRLSVVEDKAADSTDMLVCARNGKIRMKGREVYRAVSTHVGKLCIEAVDKAGIKMSDIDLFVPHQANQRITDLLTRQLGLSPDRVTSYIHDYANTSSASVPLAFARALTEGRTGSGSTVLFAGFGAGIGVSTAVVRL